MDNRSLIMISHFNIGEVITDYAKALVQLAKKETGDMAILVGDIGVDLSVHAFLRGGIDEIKKIYESRIICAETLCMQSQLPRNNDEILKIVDKGEFDFIIERIRENNNPLIQALSQDLVMKQDFSKLSSTLNDIVVPIIINKKLIELGLTAEEVKVIISEKSLRNKVGQRTKKSRKKSWLSFIDKTLILSYDNKPLCLGIMFALFEKIAEMNYNKVLFFTEKKYRRAIMKGWLLFNYSQDKILYLNSKIELVQFIDLPEEII